MQTQVKTWGNSQGTRISKEILQEANIAVDDALDVNVVNGMITLVKPFGHKTLEERAADFNGKLNLDGEYDWGEPVVKRFGMKETLHQGDIVKIERVKSPVLVTSKDFFNQTGEIIGCPIIQNSVASPLHIPMADIINITDAIQSIFDYV